MAGFKGIIPARNGIFERHMPQLDTQDRERDNPHRAGPEKWQVLLNPPVEKPTKRFCKFNFSFIRPKSSLRQTLFHLTYTLILF
jgi:hypothetical protein